MRGRESGHRQGGNPLAVAQHGDPVGQSQHFVQLMGYVHHARAPGGEPPNHPFEARPVSRAERRGGFVHDEATRARGERAGDGHQLSIAWRKVRHECIRMDVRRADGIQLLARDHRQCHTVHQSIPQARLAA